MKGDARQNNHQVFLKIALLTVVILLIPATVMQFTDEVDWGLLDFVVMGVLVFGTTSVAVLLWRNTRTQYRIPLIIGVVVFTLYVWAELAVGVFTQLGS